MLTLILYAILTGALAGILPGLFGIGGGVVLVPMINFFLIHQGFPAENIMHYAVGTSLATMVFSTASASYFQIRTQGLFIYVVVSLPAWRPFPKKPKPFRDRPPWSLPA